MISIRKRRWPIAAVVGIVPVFLGGLTLSVGGPARSLLPAFSQPSLLDYSKAPFRSYPALRAPFVDLALGDRPSAPALLDGSEPASGIGERLVVEHALTNDDFADAKRIPSVPYTAKTNTTGASRQNEAESCSASGGTVWYRYRARQNEALIADTFGTGAPTALAIFTGSALPRLRSIGCATGTGSQVAIPAASGTTYYFQVARTESAGTLVFNLTQQTTTRASVSSTGAEGLSDSTYPAISGDGRYVVFGSTSWLDPEFPPSSECWRNTSGDLTRCPMNVYVRDRVAHTTRLVSVLPNGEPANDSDARADTASISDDGRYVVFASAGNSMLPTAYKGMYSLYQIYLRDLVREETRMVSISSSGAPGNRNHGLPHISGDGRYVAFTSGSDNLVAGDTNEVIDVFVHNRLTHATTRASVSSSERQANGDECVSTVLGSDMISISRTGRFVAFWSCATNLVPGDSNRYSDVFLRDRIAGTTTRVSVSSTGRQGNADSGVRQPGVKSTISDDGRFVAFSSSARNLVRRDTNEGDDIFVRDLLRGRTMRVSVSSSGEQADQTDVPLPSPTWPVAYYSYSMTPDGRYVLFSSPATNLVQGDTNGVRDVFMHDRENRVTTRVSITESGHEANGANEALVISADGGTVAWSSAASNLVPGDTNRSDDVFVHEIPRPGEPLKGWF